MIGIKKISEYDALKIIKMDESHFFDHKSKYVEGAELQLAASTFANADGGEIYLGIDDTQDSKDISKWNGFERQEYANSRINVVSDTTPPLPVNFEFMEILGKESQGKALHIIVGKSAEVHRTSKGETWIRKGAQKRRIAGDEIINLKLSKGLISFEDQLVSNYDAKELYKSPVLQEFLSDYSPKTSPDEFLYKQRLVRKGSDDNLHPTYSGVILFSENPSTVLPKKCSIKIARYDTSEEIPRRAHLKEQYTVEGPAYALIDNALKKITKIVESNKILGEKGPENAKYPNETIKEILVNSVIHRDYNISDDILIFIYNNRIEIKNPGLLPGHITKENILQERFARNPTIVRLLNKYPDPPNKDIGEGLNTAFERMTAVKLKAPFITIQPNAIVVTIPHQPLASPEEAVIEYLKENTEITNTTARRLTGIQSENVMKNIFKKLQSRKLIDKVPGKYGSLSAWELVKS